MIGETLLSSFGFKLRNVVNFLVSVYAAAVTFSFWGHGGSGIENVARGLSLIGLDSLASQLTSSYTTVRGLTGATHYFLTFIVGTGLVISCVCFARTYNDKLPRYLDIVPNCVFGVMAYFCLGTDLFSPGSLLNLALFPIFLSVLWTSIKAVHKGRLADMFANGFGMALLMVLGLLFALIYAALLIPLWFAQGSSIDADSEEHQHN